MRLDYPTKTSLHNGRFFSCLRFQNFPLIMETTKSVTGCEHAECFLCQGTKLTDRIETKPDTLAIQLLIPQHLPCDEVVSHVVSN